MSKDEEKVLDKLREIQRENIKIFSDIAQATADRSADKAIERMMPAFREECAKIASRVVKDGKDKFFLEATGESWDQVEDVRHFFQKAIPFFSTLSGFKIAMWCGAGTALGGGAVTILVKVL